MAWYEGKSICWQRSGYEFRHIKKEKIGGIEA
jgi:hypothetical protein